MKAGKPLPKQPLRFVPANYILVVLGASGGIGQVRVSSKRSNVMELLLIMTLTASLPLAQSLPRG